jgi:hypothetical protein
MSLLTMLIVPYSHSSQFTDAEIAMMPEYCQARWGGKDKMAYKNWSQRLGESNFIHIHHYCAGLHFMNQAAMESGPKKQKHILQKAIRNFDYVLARWPKDFSLTSSAQMYRRQADMMLGFIR